VDFFRVGQKSRLSIQAGQFQLLKVSIGNESDSKEFHALKKGLKPPFCGTSVFRRRYAGSKGIFECPAAH
jgi:hypothetical protein